MSTPAEQVARSYVATGTVWDVARNRDHTTGAGKLSPQDLSATTDRLGIWLQWEMLAGFPVAHGEVADEAAMLALHTFAMDSADNPLPRYVAPGDSVLRTDDPGWRWYCLSGHGLTLADWERRPLDGALTGLAVTGHTHTLASLAEVVSALDGKQAALTNAATLTKITEAGGLPRWDGGTWPGGGGSSARGLYSGLLAASAPTVSNTGLSGWYNQESSTVVQAPHALMVSSPAGTSGISGITGTVVSGATIVALVSLGRQQTTSYPSLMLGFVDGSKFNGLALYWNPTKGRMVASVTRYSNPTTQVVATTEADYLDYSGQLWLRIRRDSTTLYWECSSSGASWRIIHSEALSGLYLVAYTTLMFGTSVSGAVPLDAVMHSLTVG